MAQAFARLGTEVTIVEAAEQVLPREDPDAAAIVRHALLGDGVDVRTDASVSSVRTNGGDVRLTLRDGDLVCDRLLVATGRTPNTASLGLEAAGVARDGERIRVDDRLRTTNARIYASGDVVSRHQFTHAADALSRIVIQNALFFGRKRVSALVVPWCTFTSPEVAHVGVTSAEARREQWATVTIGLDEVDRAMVDDETDGFVRIHHDGGRIRGATVVAPSAGELIGTIAYAMQYGRGLAELSSVVFPYPTLSLALRQAADAYQRTRLTPGVKRVLKYYFRGRSG
jgi:pyruvate/2-oxoglutarate dehydrogenase complex dihydrolipoamide dehydrogenase (E3) component